MKNLLRALAEAPEATAVGTAAAASHKMTMKHVRLYHAIKPLSSY